MHFIKRTIFLLAISSFTLAFADVVPIEDLSKSSSADIPVVPLNDSDTTGTSASKASSSSGSSAASSLSTDQRISRLEQQMQAQSGSAQQLDLLQQQVQELQGQVDEQSHQLQQLRDQLNNFYSDLDQRISGAKVKANVNAEAAQTPVAAKNTVAPSVASEEQQAYDTSFDLLKDGKYDEAVPKFKAYIKTYPQGKYVANSHYWLGEIYYLQSDLKNAISEFQIVTKTYPSSQKVPDAMFKIALIHYDQGQYSTARKEFTNIKKTYPNTSVARLADQQLKKMNMQQV
jgi:tol-pal system protein YbgF